MIKKTKGRRESDTKVVIGSRISPELFNVTKDDHLRKSFQKPKFEQNESNSLSHFLSAKISECFPNSPQPVLKKSFDLFSLDETKQVKDTKKLLELVDDKTVKVPPKRSQSLPKRRGVPKKDIRVTILPSRTVRRNQDDFNTKACLKIIHPNQKRSYSNVARFFELREKGYTNEKAVAMANRVRCNESHKTHKAQEKTTHRKIVEHALDTKLNQMVMIAKKEYMSKLYQKYMENYNGHTKKEVLEQASTIYRQEVSHINSILSPRISKPRSVAVSPKRTACLNFKRSQENTDSKWIIRSPSARKLNLTNKRAESVVKPQVKVVRMKSPAKAIERKLGTVIKSIL